MAKLTAKQIEAKRLQLSEKFKCEVSAHDLKASADDQVLMFMKPGDRLTKMRCLDLTTTGQFTQAAEILLRTCIIEEESDSRILSDDQSNDKYFLGAIMEAQKKVEFAVDSLKKK